LNPKVGKQSSVDMPPGFGFMPFYKSSACRPRVLLVENHELLRQTLQTIIEPVCEVVGEVKNGREAVTYVEQWQPHVVLLDISLSDGSGFHFIPDIAHYSPQTRIIVVSTHASESYKEQALRLGACGYVVKSEAARELCPAIQRSVDGIFRSPVAPLGEESSQPAATAIHRGKEAHQATEDFSPVCIEARELFQEFAGATQVMCQLLQQQCDAVLAADVLADRFDLLIHAANERKQECKYAYLQHMQRHRCPKNLHKALQRD
jgi:DNA-binding NarL/FixJ family response regulator